MPTINTQDKQLMARAITLAKKGQYSTSPNPCVGCIITDGETIAEGWHQIAGEGHAEVNAIKAAKEKGMNLAACTLYVTLEPCSHQGRTPPCSDRIIDEGVARVVYAMKDPNPQVAGSGLQRLRQAGIQVEGPLMAVDAAAINVGYIKRIQGGKPWVIAKIASSLDGRTAMASGESKWITGPEAREDVQRLRALSCAILTGIETVLVDNPAMTVRDQAFALPDGAIRQPLRVVVDSQLRIPLEAKLLQCPEKACVIHASNDNARIERLRQAGVDVIRLANDEGKVDLDALLDLLAERGCNQVMIESGARLFGACLEQKLIDEVFCYMAPTFLGSSARPVADIPLTYMNQQIRFVLKAMDAVGKDYRWQLIPDYLTDSDTSH